MIKSPKGKGNPRETYCSSHLNDTINSPVPSIEKGRASPRPKKRIREKDLKASRNLCQLSVGEEAIIVSIEGGHGFRNRILSMGLHPGDRVKVVRASPFRGPLLIEHLDQGFCLALGRGMAAKVLVETPEERAGE